MTTEPVPAAVPRAAPGCGGLTGLSSAEVADQLQAGRGNDPLGARRGMDRAQAGPRIDTPQAERSRVGEAECLVATLFDADLDSALKHHFGFDAFRPLQREIARDVLAGRDVFALLPTGGGKSLCFQLPAVMSDRLTVVVSPLIALMKDQVDALRAAGIAATYLNSTLEPSEVQRRIYGLDHGAYRLLYLAPERLAIPGASDDLRRWNVARFAIDEAHCISEWGHDFRPDYRRLRALRTNFADIPVLALTATATDRVRADIVNLLGLREPRCYVASFDRPNLFYRVLPKGDTFRNLLGFVRERATESGIVYVASRRQADFLAEKLSAAGIAALPYHAGLDARVRTHNQERFVRDDAGVICATIAFGMGIDKSNVRYVVHYDLPKSIEGYYQETGRAGRDGMFADCLLFYSASDVAKQLAFIDEKDDERERAHALAGLRLMQQYAETPDCRRRVLLAHFGESLGRVPCEGCDNCRAPRVRFDGTVAAQKFLSNVVRVRAAGGFSVGFNHLVDILVGKATQNVRAWNHDALTTFGIGKEFARERWLAIGRELVRLGLLRQTPGLRSTVELTAAGRRTLLERGTVLITPAPEPSHTKTTRSAAGARREPAAEGSGSGTSRFTGAQDGDGDVDMALFEELRVVRRRVADAKDVPAYVIFPDTTLRAMARDVPANAGELRRIPGVGDKKLAEFGETFLQAITAYRDRASSAPSGSAH